MKMTDPKVDHLPLWAWIAIALLLLVQGTWLYMDSRRQGARHPWFWGIWGILSAPLPTIVYLFAVRKIHRK